MELGSFLSSSACPIPCPRRDKNQTDMCEVKLRTRLEALDAELESLESILVSRREAKNEYIRGLLSVYDKAFYQDYKLEDIQGSFTNAIKTLDETNKDIHNYMQLLRTTAKSGDTLFEGYCDTDGNDGEEEKEVDEKKIVQTTKTQPEFIFEVGDPGTE